MKNEEIRLSVTDADRVLFQSQGFVVKPQVLSSELLDGLRERFAPLFAGSFETGIYPDEWYWREELSRPDVTRHMANAWKSDLTIARLVLSEEIGRAVAALAGWKGAKLGQDTIWWKPPQTKSIAYHQDT